MEVGSLQHLGDSFSYRWLKHAAQAPSFKRLVDDDVGGSSRYFIDMDPADLFSMRWTAPGSDFDFDLPGGDDAASPIPLLVSASQIFHDGRLLPHELDDGRFGVQEDGDVGDAARVAHLLSEPRLSASSPPFHSAQSTPVSLSSSSSGRSGASKHASTPPLLAGRRGGSSPWKILLRYLRFLMPLYRKVRALPPLRAPRTRVSPASPASARASTSSIDWCHGIADTAVHDAILYCKKSSGQNI
uniref:Membrane-associated kinase regulator 6 n=1 Tax=Oryza punctata TaxID=4537 RepID=A0A0E0K854_ORYPU